MLCCLNRDTQSLHSKRKREKKPGWSWSLGSWKGVWCGPSFMLGWEKPGSVAPLRLVGCLIRTPAPPWTYFYSFFFYIFLYWKDLSWPFFISLVSSSFLSYHSVVTFLCFVLQRDERKIYMLVDIVHDYVVFSPFCPFWLYFFTAATCLRARIPCQWFGWMTAVNIYWVKCLHPYALKTFMGPSKRNYVHEKYFLWVSA